MTNKKNNPETLKDTVSKIIDSYDRDDNPERPDIKAIKVLKQKVKKETEKAWKEYKKMRAKKYDGVVGIPPDCVPERDRCEFDQVQNNMISKYGVDGTREQLQEYRDYRSGKMPNSSPLKEEANLRFLDNLWFAIKQGKDKCIEILAGKSAVYGEYRMETEAPLREYTKKRTAEKEVKKDYCINMAKEMRKINPRLSQEGLAKKIKDQSTMELPTVRTIRSYLKGL